MDWKRVHANVKQKKAVVTGLISDKVDFKTKCILKRER
jgi:hypothetical protein